ncbi:hypothetical protein GCM10023192_14740 [Amycolatopsis samaneae]
MDAVIYVDTEAIHPVANGEWHHTRLNHVPAPGERITMLCGLVATAEFAHVSQRDTHGVPHTCWNCDYVYRREHDLDIWPGHPALSTRPAPRPRT